MNNTAPTKTTHTIATIKEVQALFNFQISSSTAYRKIQHIRIALNKPKPQIITMQMFCDFYGL